MVYFRAQRLQANTPSAFRLSVREDVWHLLEYAKASSMTPAEVIEHLTASLQRTLASLERRAHRGVLIAFPQPL